jgi:hypothetical protein
MADEKKKISLGGIDNAAEEKGSFIKTLWQLVKFLVVSGLVTIIQLVLVNVLYFAMKNWTAPLPVFLASIFTATTVGEGHDNWGYILPFFLSNAVANVYGYIQNKKTTFKSDAPTYCFVIYIILLACLILFSTWFQGVIANLVAGVKIAWIANLAPTVASLAAGFLQMVVLFPMEKFVLLKEKKPADGEEAPAEAE